MAPTRDARQQCFARGAFFVLPGPLIGSGETRGSVPATIPFLPMWSWARIPIFMLWPLLRRYAFLRELPIFICSNPADG